jgi:hypothetical protein
MTRPDRSLGNLGRQKYLQSMTYHSAEAVQGKCLFSADVVDDAGVDSYLSLTPATSNDPQLHPCQSRNLSARVECQAAEVNGGEIELEDVLHAIKYNANKFSSSDFLALNLGARSGRCHRVAYLELMAAPGAGTYLVHTRAASFVR